MLMVMKIKQVETEKEWEAYHHIREVQLFSPLNIAYDRNHPSLTAENIYHFIGYIGNNIVTVGMVELIDTKIAALRALATDEPYKNQGHATYMLKYLERWIKQQGRSTIKMHAALGAVSFYRKHEYIDMPFDEQPLAGVSIKMGKKLI